MNAAEAPSILQHQHQQPQVQLATCSWVTRTPHCIAKAAALNCQYRGTCWQKDVQALAGLGCTRHDSCSYNSAGHRAVTVSASIDETN